MRSLNGSNGTEKRILHNGHWIRIPFNGLFSAAVIVDNRILNHVSQFRPLIEKEKFNQVRSGE